MCPDPRRKRRRQSRHGHARPQPLSGWQRRCHPAQSRHRRRSGPPVEGSGSAQRSLHQEHDGPETVHRHQTGPEPRWPHGFADGEIPVDHQRMGPQLRPLSALYL